MWNLMCVNMNLSWIWWVLCCWSVCVHWGRCRRSLGWSIWFPCCIPIFVGVMWVKLLINYACVCVWLVVSLISCKVGWVRKYLFSGIISGKVWFAIMGCRQPRYYWCSSRRILGQYRWLWLRWGKYSHCGFSYCYNTTEERHRYGVSSEVLGTTVSGVAGITLRIRGNRKRGKL